MGDCEARYQELREAVILLVGGGHVFLNTNDIAFPGVEVKRVAALVGIDLMIPAEKRAEDRRRAAASPAPPPLPRLPRRSDVR